MPTSGVCEKLECRFKLLSQLPGEFLVLILYRRTRRWSTTLCSMEATAELWALLYKERIRIVYTLANAINRLK